MCMDGGVYTVGGAGRRTERWRVEWGLGDE